jgi:anion-transporting  ArsA/GET3 family ATPase
VRRGARPDADAASPLKLFLTASSTFWNWPSAAPVLSTEQMERPELEALFGRRVLVCAGSGGVGKTTLAAALSVVAARTGRRVLTLTIDPAKRLADSLGVRADSSERQYLTRDRLQILGVESGELSVMMLDPSRTLQELVRQLAPTPAAAERILSHPLFVYLSDYLAGTNEYMAMEKLLAVLQAGNFDLLVLDTPPTRHALDFLRAPERLVDAIEGPVMRAMGRAVDDARRFSLDWVAKGAEVMVRGLGKLTGAGLLEQVATLIADLNSIFGGFQERAKRVSLAFRDPSFAYLLITRPSELAVADTRYFAQALRDTGMRVDAVIVNGVHASVDESTLAAATLELTPTLGKELSERVRAAAEARIAQVAEERSHLRQLEELEASPDLVFLTLPVIAGGVPDLPALASLCDSLSGRHSVA